MIKESEEDHDMSLTLMSLPSEIRKVIYNKIPQSEILELRRVCRTWRQEIDELYEFTILINDLKEIKWDRISNLSFKSVEIQSFTRPPPLGIGTKFLKFPSLVKSIKMHSSFISPLNFYYLLSDTSPYLKELSLILSNELITFLYPTSFSCFSFRNMRRMTVGFSNLPREPYASEGIFEKCNSSIFCELMSNHSLSSLQKLDIDLKVIHNSQVSTYISSVLSLISNQYYTLRSLNFELIQGLHGIPNLEPRPLNESDSSKINLVKLNKLSSLTWLRIVSSSSIGVDLWANFIENQKSLEYFESDIIPVPNSLFSTLAQNNFSTLKIVEITDMIVWENDTDIAFDLKVFSNCLSLQRLVLDRNVGSLTNRRRNECAELLNLHLLPNQLEELALNYFNILTQELIQLCSTELMGFGTNLQTITLNQCGCMGIFGVNGTALEKLIAVPSVQFVEISSLNYSNAGERKRLNSILVKNGFTEGHSYFQYSRGMNFMHMRLYNDLLDDVEFSD